MPRAATPTFVCELPLALSGAGERRLQIRLDCARQVYNAVLGESLKRLGLLRQSKAFQVAQTIPKRSKEQQRERAAAFRALDAQFRLREYDLHAYAVQFGRSWLSEHLDANTIQTVASRAWNAVRQYQFGVRGRPRFRGKGQFHSVEGKTNKQGIRWRDGVVIWGDLRLRARISADDPVIAHALTCPIKYVRIVRRTLNGRVRFFAQLICAGKPYQKPQNVVGDGVIGIDPGPSTFGIAGADWGTQVDLATPLQMSRQKQRQLQRRIDRQRRANNPQNYLPDGRVRPGPKRWAISQNQCDSEWRLTEAKRKEVAHRKSLHGQLANTILRLGHDIRIEKNSYKSFQKSFGKAVGLSAPATFVAVLSRKAESAGASVTVIPTSLRLSQTCLCGTIARKTFPSASTAAIVVLRCSGTCSRPILRASPSPWMGLLVRPGGSMRIRPAWPGRVPNRASRRRRDRSTSRPSRPGRASNPRAALPMGTPTCCPLWTAGRSGSSGKLAR